MLCVLMIAGGYVLLPVANPCDDPRCIRVKAEVGQMLTGPNELPSSNWLRFSGHPLLVCLTQLTEK